MATKETLYGRLSVLMKSGVQLDNLLSNGIKQSTATRNVTTKDSNNMDESRPTIKTQSMDFKGYASNQSSANYVALQTSRDTQAIETWRFDTGIPGSRYWSASGFITQLDLEAAHDGTVEFTGTVQITGDLTFGTI